MKVHRMLWEGLVCDFVSACDCVGARRGFAMGSIQHSMGVCSMRATGMFVLAKSQSLCLEGCRRAAALGGNSCCMDSLCFLLLPAKI